MGTSHKTLLLLAACASVSIFQCRKSASVAVADDAAPRAPTPVPRAPHPVRPEPRLALGRWHSCLAGKDGSVTCWGQNAQGQIGDGTLVRRRIPVHVESVFHAVGMAVKQTPDGTYGQDEGTYVRTVGKTLSCWGVCDPELVEVNAASPPSSGRLAGLEAMWMEGRNACFARAGGLACKGDSWLTLDKPTIPNLPVPVDVAIAPTGACALLPDGALWCWGDAREGQIPSEKGVVGAPRRVLTGVDWVAGREGLFCARKDGAVSCWGHPAPLAALGVPALDEVWWTPRAVSALDSFEGLAFGGMVCAWKRDEALCGTTGTGPYRIEVSKIIDLEVGARHACALAADDAVWCWGDNTEGQLGDGSLASRTKAARVVGLGPGAPAAPSPPSTGVPTGYVAKVAHKGVGLLATSWTSTDGEPSLATTVFVEHLDASGMVTVADAQRAIGDTLGVLDVCYAASLFKDRGTKGSVRFALQVDAKFVTSSVLRTGGTMFGDPKDPAHLKGTTCMLDALRGLKATTGPGKIVVWIDFQNDT